MVKWVVIMMVCLIGTGWAQTDSTGEDDHLKDRWSPAKAWQWYGEKPWLVGTNYVPQYAINQLEMWQEDTFDLEKIDQELQWAHELGFTSMRVFLHNLLWEQDSEGFLERMEQFLDVAEKHEIGVMFVLFDSVWDPYPKLGKQREPHPHRHNSGWVQAPGAEILGDPSRHDEMREYVIGVISHFRDDPRVHVWDIWNEPDNPVPQYADVDLPNKETAALPLLKKAFAWAREARPSQPLTTGVWRGRWAKGSEELTETQVFQLEASDLMSFHTYDPPKGAMKDVNELRQYGRPILCTEYMARGAGSTFDPIMGYFKDQGVGAYNWGFVDGKSQTIYPWDSWKKEYTGEPDPWFHDILRANGEPYDAAEVSYIRSVTGSAEK